MLPTMSRPLYVLSAADVWDVSSQLGVNVILDTIFDALRAVVVPEGTPSAEVVMPHRTSIESRECTTLFMPSRLKDCMVVKVVSVPKGAGRGDGGGGLPATTLVVNPSSGGVEVVVNARSLTALRTAAASTIATKLLLESASPTRLVLFGAGAQVHAHARLLITSFPSIAQCTIINRSRNTRLSTLLESLRAEFLHVNVIGISGTWNNSSGDIERAVREADIIVTATSSTVPLFPSAWVKTGAHINLVGSFTPSMKEVDDDLIHRSRVVLVDSRAACAREAGELISAKVDFEKKCVELGECTWNSGPIKPAENGDITVFKSVGISVMDAAITNLVVSAAEEQGRGVHIPFD